MTTETIVVFTVVLIAAAAVVSTLWRCAQAKRELDEMAKKSKR